MKLGETIFEIIKLFIPNSDMSSIVYEIYSSLIDEELDIPLVYGSRYYILKMEIEKNDILNGIGYMENNKYVGAGRFFKIDLNDMDITNIPYPLNKELTKKLMIAKNMLKEHSHGTDI